MLSIIAAVSDNLAIGKDNNLLWHISEDLKYFKRVTTGHPVIMGYNTFLSLGGRPLPKRTNVIVSRRHEAPTGSQVLFCKSLDEALRKAAGSNEEQGDEETFVIGGGQLYRSALPDADRLYITEVHTVISDADTFFPEIDRNLWKETSRSETMLDEKTGYRYTFVIYDRIRYSL